ncbi:hypothetical protein DLM76_12925 [Leptospira yasudae]|uniref:Uncharacterized protein n=1 Tax=Leptospira yasudae TaxID=2202201 RepID=A0A5F2BBG0_9LEPT|nr:hypothetical protein [Leptospira yasudae]RHX80173.1 hypothetical protein DLM77_09975 [Leptospira yasudae]RHX93884.1 hypothetical protein DLM76_12925 [Leptospira yasudae]TGK25702.1 hypothetical protein EHQ05_12495 [Leptospira yasudae]TGL76133.1 hypothetical protein EHQ77_19465 [Leptospira yasudae]
MTFILKCRASQKIAIAFFRAKTGKSSSFLSHSHSKPDAKEIKGKSLTFLPCRREPTSFESLRP